MAQTVRLCQIAADRWEEIDAHYHASPVPLLRMGPRRFASMVYVWCIERVPPEKLEQWIADLSEPLPWQDGDDDAGAELESASFFAMQGKGG